MSDKPLDDDDYEVGYGRPPRHSRWPKGVSGNPKGASKKKKPPATLADDFHHPTRSAIRREAMRAVTIRDADERKEVTMIQAVMMALANTAVKGGVMAQRTFIELQMAEDEREFAARKANFDFWQRHKYEAKAQLEAARRTGRRPPRLVPHPDDIVLNYATLAVKILGAVDEGELQRLEALAELRDFCRELSHYRSEQNFVVPGDDDATQLGTAMAASVILELILPPSLRSDPAAITQRLIERVILPRSHWTDSLDAQCDKLGLPRVGYRSPMKTSPTYRLRDYGLSWKNGAIAVA